MLQAAALVPPGHKGDWHFCRGVWDSEAQRFKSYAELGKHCKNINFVLLLVLLL